MLFALLLLVARCGESAPTRPSGAGACIGYGQQLSSPYVLPYLPGQRYLIVQGNCSSGPTHTPASVFKYGYDFGMEIGTRVYAARAGVVVGVDERNTDLNGANQPANYVWVRQGDGTIGRYWHLTHDGALVDVGQSVEPGDLIGLSGATGLGPGFPAHLHFDEAECGPNTCQSRPVNFRNTSPNPNGLQVGQTYTAQ